MKTITIGALYLNHVHFKDEANQTTGAPAVGPDMVQIIENRRNVTSRLTDSGKQAKEQVKAYFKEKYGLEVALRWSQYAGCSMCPCSPGFKIQIEVDMAKIPSYKIYPLGTRANSKDRYEYNVWINEDGTVDARQPKGRDILAEVFKPVAEVQ